MAYVCMYVCMLDLDQRRPDIVVLDFSEGHELQLDFSATHPCLMTNLNLASREPGQRLPGGSRRRGIATATAMASLSPSYVSSTVVGGLQQLNS